MASARRRALALLAGAVLAACGPATGPQPIAFDREACAHCRMLISEPSFSAQLQAEDGVPLDALERVRCPIGLPLGGETPEEIAVAIVAELLQVRHRAP